MIFNRLKKILSYKEVLWNNSKKELKAKYANSFMGIWLVIINPVLVMLAVTFVFKFIYEVKVEMFPVFVLSGILPWLFFSNTLFEGSFSLVQHQAVLRQFSLQKDIIPISSALANFMNFLIGWIIILPVFCIMNPKVILVIPLLVPVLIFSFLVSCGMVLILSVLNVFFRDVGHLLGVVMMFWFWVTPIFYSLEMVPLKVRWVCALNPITPYIVCYRDILFRGSSPSLAAWGGIVFWGVGSLLLGIHIFCLFESKILKRI